MSLFLLQFHVNVFLTSIINHFAILMSSFISGNIMLTVGGNFHLETARDLPIETLCSSKHKKRLGDC